MDISPNSLRRETLATMRGIDEQISDIDSYIESNDLTKGGRRLEATELRDQNGAFVMPPLLLARAQCLNTLAILRGK